MKSYLLLLVAIKHPEIDIDTLIEELRKMSLEDSTRVLEMLAGAKYGI